VKSQGRWNCFVWKSIGGVHKTIAYIQTRDKGDEHQVHRRVLAERYGIRTQWIVNKARRSAAELKLMTN
jgi:hypothetical protein